MSNKILCVACGLRPRINGHWTICTPCLSRWFHLKEVMVAHRSEFRISERAWLCLMRMLPPHVMLCAAGDPFEAAMQYLCHLTDEDLRAERNVGSKTATAIRAALVSWSGRVPCEHCGGTGRVLS